MYRTENCRSPTNKYNSRRNSGSLTIARKMNTTGPSKGHCALHSGPNGRTGDTNSNRGSNRRFQETFGSEPARNRFETVDPVNRIGARSSMPNPSVPDHRCRIHRKQNGSAMCRQRVTHSTDFSSHRCPMTDAQSIGKYMEVRFAAGGRQIEPTFPRIGARFQGTPNPSPRMSNP